MDGREFADATEAPDEAAAAGRRLNRDLLERVWITPWHPAIAEEQFLRCCRTTR
jgi:hypothetical protein